jgi:hypothetical protein
MFQQTDYPPWQAPFRTNFEDIEVNGATIRTLPAQGLFPDQGLSAKQSTTRRKTGKSREPKVAKKEVVLYAYERRQLKPLGANFSDQDLKKRSKPWWNRELPVYQYYFIDGIYGDPYDPKKRFIMFDFNTTNRCTLRLEARAREIMRGLWTTHSGVWNPQISFYDNIKDNDKTAMVPVGLQFVKRTIGEEWSSQWKKAIRNEIFTQQQAQGPAAVFAVIFMGDNFWYTQSRESWKKIIGVRHTREMYLEFSDEKFQEHQEHIALNKNVITEGQIPLPKSRLRSNPSRTVKTTDQQEHLETQRQQENTQFLLNQVIQRLDSLDT